MTRIYSSDRVPRGYHPTPRARVHFVYRCYDTAGDLIYVGCSVNPVARVEGHRLNSWWGNQIATVRNLVFPNGDVALYQERKAIYEEKPKHNIKNRWYKLDTRAHWTVDDYDHFAEAIRRGGIHGGRTGVLLADVLAERDARFPEAGAA